MTCIVAVATPNGRVHMGADSAGVGGLSMALRKDSKLFVKSNMVFGCTSSFRMIQLLRYSLVIPRRHPDVDLHDYMCTAFIQSVRECFRAGGFLRKDQEVENGGVFLVGVEGHVYRIDSDFQVGERHDGFDACGCGEDIALGSLYQSRLQPDVRVRLTDALAAAEHFSAGVRGPFLFDETPAVGVAS